jgi:hypothetical protein
MTADPLPQTKTHSKDAVALGAIEFQRKANGRVPASGTAELEELCGTAKPWLADIGQVLGSQAGIIKVQITRTLDSGTLDLFSARNTSTRAVKHLLRAAEHCEAASAEIGLQWKDFIRMYDAWVNPGKAQFEFKRHN